MSGIRRCCVGVEIFESRLWPMWEDGRLILCTVEVLLLRSRHSDLHSLLSSLPQAMDAYIERTLFHNGPVQICFDSEAKEGILV